MITNLIRKENLMHRYHKAEVHFLISISVILVLITPLLTKDKRKQTLSDNSHLSEFNLASN